MWRMLRWEGIGGLVRRAHGEEACQRNHCCWMRSNIEQPMPLQGIEACGVRHLENTWLMMITRKSFREARRRLALRIKGDDGWFILYTNFSRSFKALGVSQPILGEVV